MTVPRILHQPCTGYGNAKGVAVVTVVIVFSGRIDLHIYNNPVVRQLRSQATIEERFLPTYTATVLVSVPTCTNLGSQQLTVCRNLRYRGHDGNMSVSNSAWSVNCIGTLQGQTIYSLHYIRITKRNCLIVKCHMPGANLEKDRGRARRHSLHTLRTFDGTRSK